MSRISRAPMPTHWLRHCNNVLSCAVLLLGLYIIFLPFIPNVQFWVNKETHHYPTLVRQNTGSADKSIAHEPIPAQNTLVIPAMGLQETINEGASAAALNKGVWRRPHTSTPSAGSNTVLVGHRFTYTNPRGVFYHLDKVGVNDKIVVYWQGKKYVYRVTAITVVAPTAIEIEAPTDQPVLTLYTCTPLWSAHDRLVVRAVLVEGN